MLRAARHAQCVCVPSPPPPQAVAFAARLLGTHAPSWTRDELAAARAELDRHTVAAGRSAGSVQLALRCAVRRVGEEKAPLDEAVEALRVVCARYAAAGVDSMTLDIPGGSWQEAMDCLEAVGERILPGLA